MPSGSQKKSFASSARTLLVNLCLSDTQMEGLCTPTVPPADTQTPARPALALGLEKPGSRLQRDSKSFPKLFICVSRNKGKVWAPGRCCPWETGRFTAHCSLCECQWKGLTPSPTPPQDHDSPGGYSHPKHKPTLKGRRCRHRRGLEMGVCLAQASVQGAEA